MQCRINNLKVRIPFSVAYGSDMERVKEILLSIAREAAEKTAWVITDPAPSVYFLEFGESALTGQLILWTNNYDYSWDVQDWVNNRIARRFAMRRSRSRSGRWMCGCGIPGAPDARRADFRVHFVYRCIFLFIIVSGQRALRDYGR